MFKKILKSFALVAILLTLVALSGSAALAWTGPGTLTPPACTGLEGCNPPINTGPTTQIKAGSLGILGILGLITGQQIDFASDLGATTGSPDRASNAGIVGYRKTYNYDWNGIMPYVPAPAGNQRQALVITGGGAAGQDGNRLVKLWDNLDVVGTTTASNVDVHNTITTNDLVVNNDLRAKNFYICTSPTSCTTFTGGGGYWTKDASTNKISNNNSNADVGITGTLDLGWSYTSTGPTPQREANAGKISYKRWSNGLDIVGAGTDGTNRWVKIWDNLEVPGTTTINNLVATNICTATGSCSPVTNIGGGYWTKDASDDIASNNTGTTVSVPNNKVFKVGGAYLSSGTGFNGGVDLAGLSNNAWFNGTAWTFSGTKGALVQLYDKDISLYSNDGANFTNRMIIKGDNGAVGIGTTTPGRELVIQSNTGAQIMLAATDSASWSGIQWLSPSYKGYSGMNATDGHFFVDMNENGEDLTIRDGGVVGINNPNPGTNLDVYGYTSTVGLVIPYLGLAPGFGNLIDLGMGAGGREEANAGKIAYKGWSDSLDIVGAGPGKNRAVRVYDRLNIGSNISNVGGPSTPDTYKIKIYGSDAVSNNNYGLGVEPSNMWFNVSSGAGYKFYAGAGTGKSFIELGAGVAGKEANAGKIAYEKWSTGAGGGPQALDIVGAGPSGSPRQVKIWDMLLTNMICNADKSKCTTVDKIIDHVGTEGPGPVVTPEPTIYVNDAPAGSTVILEDRDYGFHVDVSNATPSCFVRMAWTHPTDIPVNGSMTLPGTYNGFYFPKNASRDSDTITLYCDGTDHGSVTVQIRPQISNFQAKRDGNNIVYTWNSRTGVKELGKNGDGDGSIQCTLNATEKYYITNSDTLKTSRIATETFPVESDNNHRGNNDDPCEVDHINYSQHCQIHDSLTCKSIVTGLESNTVWADYDYPNLNSWY